MKTNFSDRHPLSATTQHRDSHNSCETNLSKILWAQPSPHTIKKRIFGLLVLFLCLAFYQSNGQTINTVPGIIWKPFGNCANDGAGNLYYACEIDHVVCKIDASGTMTILAGDPAHPGYSGDGGPASSAHLNSPWGVAVDASGNIYVSDGQSNVIRKINTSGIISTYAGTGTRYYSGDGGYATSATLCGPGGITVDATGNLYICDVGNNVVRKVNTSGIISTVVGNGYGAGSTLPFYGGYSGDGGAATAAEMFAPDGIAVDGTGNIFITDNGNNVIRKVNTSGVISTYGGTAGTTGNSGDGGPVSAALFNYLTQLAFDGSGNLLICDATNQKIRMVNPFGIISTYAGDGYINPSYPLYGGYSGDGGPATAAELNRPYGVSVDMSGNVYIVDAFNYEMREVTGNVFTVCVGATMSITGTTTSGTWSSSTTAVATVDASTGVVTGVSTGTSTISYTYSGTTYTSVVTVVGPPSGVSGSASVCPGGTTTVSDASTGGGWVSGDVTIATVDWTTGVVTGVAAGTVLISYATIPGCAATITVTVNPLPAAITGLTTICGTGAMTTLYDASGGGTWSSMDPSTGTVDATSGVVTGTGYGTVDIIYTLPTGCSISTSVDVDHLPDAITGTTAICTTGGMTTLSDATHGGTWSSDNTSVATIDGTGTVTGTGYGTATIYYTLATGCNISTVVTVGPAPVTGTNYICNPPNTTSLTDASPGGTWSSSDGSIAIVDGAGVVTAVDYGTATIYYTSATGCASSEVVSIGPGPITGSPCIGDLSSTTSLGNILSGGTWTSSNTAIATVDGSGVVTPTTWGTATIIYSLNGCSSSVVVTVGPQPITGTGYICTNSGTTSLTDATTGGTWSSGNPGIGTVDASGNVTATGGYGIVPIIYTLSTGCSAGIQVVVGPAPIAGPTVVCGLGSSITLSDPFPTTGIWTSSNTVVATVGSSTGIVTGNITFGITTITFTSNWGCSVTMTVSVDPNPGTIVTTTSTLCWPNFATALNCNPTGGLWTSSNTAIATVGSTSGTVRGVGGGTCTVTYTLPSGCYSTITITNEAIIGPSTVCAGSTIRLTDISTGGTWTSTTTTVGTIGSSSGIVTGVSSGTTTITYRPVPGAGCNIILMTVTVNPLPSISGTSFSANPVCAGSSETITATASGGSGTYVAYQWSGPGGYSTTTGAGSTTINPINPIGSGIYHVRVGDNNGCRSSLAATTTLTVDPLPAVSVAASPNPICEGDMLSLSASVSSGTGTYVTYSWTGPNSFTSPITNPSISPVTLAAAGVYSFTATDDDGCTSPVGTTASVVVNPLPVLFNVTPSVASVDGTHVGLDGSDATGSGSGVSYQLYHDDLSHPMGSPMLGTGSALDFGGMRDGTYYIVATDVATGCYLQMSGDAFIGLGYKQVLPNNGVTSAGTLSIIPNPNTGNFSIAGAAGLISNVQEVKIEITDMLGQQILVVRAPVTNGTINQEINLGYGLASGIYQVKVSTNSASQVLRFTLSR